MDMSAMPGVRVIEGDETSAILISADGQDPKYGNASHNYVISWTRTFPDG
jgi:hypothetical protein